MLFFLSSRHPRIRLSLDEDLKWIGGDHKGDLYDTYLCKLILKLIR